MVAKQLMPCWSHCFLTQESFLHRLSLWFTGCIPVNGYLLNTAGDWQPSLRVGGGWRMSNASSISCYRNWVEVAPRPSGQKCVAKGHQRHSNSGKQSPHIGEQQQ